VQGLTESAELKYLKTVDAGILLYNYKRINKIFCFQGDNGHEGYDELAV